MAYRSRFQGSTVFYTPGFPQGVKWLLISNVAVFLLGFFAQLLGIDGPLALLALVPAQVLKLGYIWQLVTYLFLHGGVMHILWNMLALWMFGADLEKAWGTKRFLQFYFFCGIGAGVCVVLANAILPWGNLYVPTIGCSGAIFGILLAYAILYPTRTILFGFLIPIQVKYFVIIVGAIAFLNSFSVNRGVSEFAHLGGLLFGYIFLKMPRKGFDFSGQLQRGYRDWRTSRNKRKFQVYLKKHGSDREPRIH